MPYQKESPSYDLTLDYAILKAELCDEILIAGVVAKYEHTFSESLCTPMYIISSVIWEI